MKNFKSIIYTFLYELYYHSLLENIVKWMHMLTYIPDNRDNDEILIDEIQKYQTEIEKYRLEIKQLTEKATEADNQIKNLTKDD